MGFARCSIPGYGLQESGEISYLRCDMVGFRDRFSFGFFADRAVLGSLVLRWVGAVGAELGNSVEMCQGVVVGCRPRRLHLCMFFVLSDRAGYYYSDDKSRH